MADPTNVTLPLTAGKIRRGVCAIVEKVHPLPRQEMCLPVGDMERELTTYANELVSSAYTDASRDIVRLREELAEAKKALRDAGEAILGVVENGSWASDPDPQTANRARRYLADACYAIATDAGLTKVAEACQRALHGEVSRG